MSSFIMSTLYEDAWLVAAEKEGGIPSCGEGSFEKRLQKKFPAANLIHRLDNETSGLMVAALTEEARRKLRALWKMEQVVKRYTALVLGRTPAAGEIETPIAHHHKKKKKMGVGGEGGRPAQTRFRTLKHLRGFSLLEVEITTGVRHQIRAHLASRGNPVAGDKVYLRGKHRARTPKAPPRHFLHLGYLQLPHPFTGQILKWHSPLPKDLQDFLASLAP